MSLGFMVKHPVLRETPHHIDQLDVLRNRVHVFCARGSERKILMVLKLGAEILTKWMRPCPLSCVIISNCEFVTIDKLSSIVYNQ